METGLSSQSRYQLQQLQLSACVVGRVGCPCSSTLPLLPHASYTCRRLSCVLDNNGFLSISRVMHPTSRKKTSLVRYTCMRRARQTTSSVTLRPGMFACAAWAGQSAPLRAQGRGQVLTGYPTAASLPARSCRCRRPYFRCRCPCRPRRRRCCSCPSSDKRHQPRRCRSCCRQPRRCLCRRCRRQCCSSYRGRHCHHYHNFRQRQPSGPPQLPPLARCLSAPASSSEGTACSCSHQQVLLRHHGSPREQHHHQPAQLHQRVFTPMPRATWPFAGPSGRLRPPRAYPPRPRHRKHPTGVQRHH